MKFFSIDDLVYSNVAIKYGIKNNPSNAEKKHIVEFIENLLDPLVEKWTAYCKEKGYGSGKIGIVAGFRSNNVNKIVGGVFNSAHLLGYAADIKPLNKKYDEFEKWISTDFAKSDILFDQIIKERTKSGRWIHIGYKNFNGDQRKQTFSV